MNYSKLKQAIKSKKISINSLSEQIGMSRNGFDSMIENKSMKVDILESICAILKVNPLDFLETDIIKEENADYKIGEVEHLKELLKEREKILAEKERTIQILLNKKP
jgi:DNA-binding Xre family transcriptional regulator